MDVDQIQAGAQFPTVVRRALDEADVLLAVIGQHWLTLTAENGGRRIDQPDDWVAEEIGIALRRGTPIVPVLFDGARMPGRDDLPPALVDFANWQALRISHESFGPDSERLIETIERVVSAVEPETVNLWEDPDYPQARGAFLQGLWPLAIEGFERVLRRHPRQPHVKEQMAEAKRKQHLLDLDAAADRAAQAGRWQAAVDSLKEIDALQPSDEVKDRLAQAQLRLRLTELQNDVRALAKNGNWKAVLAADAELTRLEPKAGDPEGLATKARAELLEEDLAASYARGVRQLDQRDWTEAEGTFRALLDRRAGYRDAEGLLALARRKGKPEEQPEPPPKPLARKPVAKESASLPRDVAQPATPNPEASGRVATTAAQHGSKKYGWAILLTFGGILVAVAIIALALSLQHWNANPTDLLLSHLPVTERSTCKSVAASEGERAAVTCATGSYKLWEDGADARRSLHSRLYSSSEGDCLRPPGHSGASQDWSKDGMSGALTCDYGAEYSVTWSIDQLGITGTFTGDSSTLYKDVLSKALKIRDQVN
jgi:tetratricopeptide (TPR) repeat protein